MFSWDKFIYAESEKLLNYINKITGNIDDAKDIAQNTFLACYQNIDRIDQNFIIPWLYKTAHNKAINFLKKNKKFTSFDNINYVINAESPNNENDTQQIELQKFVISCFRKLKPKHSMILDLQFYQKKSYKEISEITGISVSAVESLLVRAKKECKKIMKDLNYKDVLYSKFERM